VDEPKPARTIPEDEFHVGYTIVQMTQSDKWWFKEAEKRMSSTYIYSFTFTYSVGHSNHRWNKPNLTMRGKHMRHKRRHCNDVSVVDAEMMCDEYAGSALTTSDYIWYDVNTCMHIVHMRICSDTSVKEQGMGCLADYIVRKEKSKKKTKKQVRYHLIKRNNIIICHTLVAHNILQQCVIHKRRSSTIDKCIE
jgi:hypothetical protein